MTTQMPRFTALTLDDQDEILVAFMWAQERDLFLHTVNKQRFEGILADVAEGPFRDRIAKLLADTQTRLAEVDAIIKNTLPQMPPVARTDAALARLRARGLL